MGNEKHFANLCKEFGKMRKVKVIRKLVDVSSLEAMPRFDFSLYFHDSLSAHRNTQSQFLGRIEKFHLTLAKDPCFSACINPPHF